MQNREELVNQKSVIPTSIYCVSTEVGATGLMVMVRPVDTGGGAYFSTLSSPNNKSSFSCGHW